MGQFSADIAALHRAAQEVAEARRNLLTQRSRVRKTVDSLLDSGWEGDARKTYQSGWTEWNTNADQVLKGLDEMAGAIEATLRDYESQDSLAATGFHHVGNSMDESAAPGRVRLNV